MSAPIEFSILGPIRAVREGSELELGSPKQRAVLALLLINANIPMSADQMIDALWGDTPPASATATLQAYISNLRKVLEPERMRREPASILQKNGAGYFICVDDSQLDSLRFTRLVTDAAPFIETNPQRGLKMVKEALRLWQGPALADFRYDDFAAAESSRLEEMRLTAVEMRFAAELELGESQTLIPELEGLVTAFPLREKLWEYLMLALYRSSRQAEALRAYRRFESALAEMGIIPGEALRNLEQSILEQDPGLTAGQASGPTTHSSATKLVGRDAERATFENALEEARAGRPSLILIEGEAGIGKTRLMEELEATARGSGMRTAFSRCVEIGGTPPFWPWMQICRRLGPHDLATAAGNRARQLAPLLGDSPEGPPVSHLFQLAEGLGEALVQMSKTQPVVLFIDDLYSADPDSLHLLTLLANEIQDDPVVIVASHRGPDPRPSHPLNRLLADVSRLDRALRVLIRPFDLPEMADLAASMTDDAIDGETIRAIYERTEGNVFYSREIFRLLMEEGAVGPGSPGTLLPSSVLEVVGRRISGLSSDALSLIRQAALFGRSFDLRFVAEVLGLDRDTCLAAIDEIVATGLVSETFAPGVYRFSHMIVVESIVQPLGALRRAQMHADIADRLEALPGDGHDRWVEIAHHRVRAIPLHGRRHAIEALTRAGEHAFLANAVELAEELYGLRHQLVMEEPRSPHRDRMEIDSLFDLGRVWTWNEGFHSPRLKDASRRLWELTGIISGEIDFDLDTPITSMNPVLASFQSRFSVEIVSGDINAAWKTSKRLLALAETTPDPMIVYSANQTALTTLVHMGRVADALTAAAKAHSALRVLNPAHDNSLMLPLGQQPAWLTYHSFAAWAHWLAGDPQTAAAEMKSARVLCEISKNPFVAGFCSTIEGVIAAMSSEPEKIFDSQQWRLSVSPDRIFGVVDDWMRLQRTWAEGMLGDDPLKAADDARLLIEQLERSQAKVSHTLYWGLASQLALRGEDGPLAIALTQRGIQHALMSGERFWYSELERLAGHALRMQGRRDEARQALIRSRQAAEKLGVTALVNRMASLSQS